MLKISVYDLTGKEIEKIQLPLQVFNAKVNQDLMAQAVRVYLSNKRQGTASTKTRGEVNGSTRKIYRQKGTGRARHGSIRAPLFRKGGIVFGPKPKEYRLDLPQKMRQAALYSALGSKLQEKSILVVSGLEQIKQKTKEIVKVFKNLKFQPEKEKVLIVIKGLQENIIRAARNLQNTKIAEVKLLNTYDILNSNKILFTKEAIETFSPVKKPHKNFPPLKSTKDTPVRTKSTNIRLKKQKIIQVIKNE